MNSLPETRASLLVRLPDAADVGAWDEFVAIYGPLIRRLALRRGLQSADADDLAQEVFSAVARSIDTWLENPQRGSFRPWLLRIARNLTVNFLTRPKYRVLGTGDSHVARMLGEHPDPQGGEESEFDWEYRRELFRWAAAQVRERVSSATWQAFWLTAVEDEAVRDVAARLNISVGSVYIARSRVMAQLRDVIRTFEEEQA
jgi:RNA polymerase sigma-70 factor (ECF subfamily)